MTAEKLPYRLIRKYKDLEYDDACQIARIAIWQAQQDYDPNRGAWSTFMYSRVRTALWTAARSAKGDPLTDSEQVEETSISCDDADFDCLSEDLKTLFTDEEVTLLKLRYEGYSYREIGERFGVCREVVRQRIQNLKKVVEAYYNGTL